MSIFGIPPQYLALSASCTRAPAHCHFQPGAGCSDRVHCLHVPSPHLQVLSFLLRIPFLSLPKLSSQSQEWRRLSGSCPNTELQLESRLLQALLLHCLVMIPPLLAGLSPSKGSTDSRSSVRFTNVCAVSSPSSSSQQILSSLPIYPQTSWLC